VTALQPALAPLALIAAVARNGVIGKDGALPWHVSEDLKHFKKTTDGHVIIMGRKTHDSIGRPLPKRRNIVVTRQTGARFPGCEAAHSLDEAIALARTTDDCPFIIGGASLYKEALPLATELHLTTIDEDVAGDTYFPEDLSEFVEVESRPGETPPPAAGQLRFAVQRVWSCWLRTVYARCPWESSAKIAGILPLGCGACRPGGVCSPPAPFG
jgi:dihydrofolate reductase